MKKNQIVIAIVLSTLIAILSQCTGASRNDLWDLLDEIQRKYFPQTSINKVILQDPDAINRRVIRDIDRALEKITPEYDRIISEYNQRFNPRYQDLKNDETLCYTDECKSLAPPMRLCAPWLDNCPKD